VFDGVESIDEKHASYRKMMPQLQGMVLSKVPNGGFGPQQQPRVIIGADASGATYDVGMPSLFLQPENPNKRMSVMPAGPLVNVDGPRSQGLMKEHDGKYRSRHGNVSMKYWQQEAERDRRRTQRSRDDRIDKMLDDAGMDRLPGSQPAEALAQLDDASYQEQQYVMQQQQQAALRQAYDMGVAKGRTDAALASSAFAGGTAASGDSSGRGSRGGVDNEASSTRRKRGASSGGDTTSTRVSSQALNGAGVRATHTSATSMLVSTAKAMASDVSALAQKAGAALAARSGLFGAVGATGAPPGPASVQPVSERGCSSGSAPTQFPATKSHSATDIALIVVMCVFIVMFVATLITALVKGARLKAEIRKLKAQFPVAAAFVASKRRQA
jgi:hypothetical protein